MKGYLFLLSILALLAVAGSCSQPATEAPPSATLALPPANLDIVSIQARASIAWKLPCSPIAGTRSAITSPAPFDSNKPPTELATGYPACSKDGRLLVINEKSVACLEPATGAEVWRFHLGTNLVDVTTAGDAVLVYGVDEAGGYLKLLDLSGTFKGELKSLPPNARVEAHGNTIFVGTHNTLLAFDIESRDRLWGVVFAEISAPYRRIERWSASPPCAYVEVRDETANLDTLLAYDARTGKVMWTKLGRVQYADEHCVYIYKQQMNRLFVRENSTGELFHAIDLRPFDGRFIDVIPTRLIFTSNQRYYDGEYLRVAPGEVPAVEPTVSLMRELLSTDFNMSHVKWHIPLGSSAESDVYAIFISDEAIVLGRGVVGAGPGVYALSEIYVHDATDGSLLWKATIPQGWVNLAIWKKMLFARSSGGILYAFTWEPRASHHVDVDVEPLRE